MDDPEQLALPEARKDLLRSEGIPCIGEAGENVFMRDAGIIGGNFSLGPTIREQADNELNRKTRAADNRFPKQYIRVDRKARMFGDIGHRALRVAEEY